MKSAAHHYDARIVWDGNRGDGTASYTSYDRSYRVLVRDKPELRGTADPAFRGDPAQHNPEELFLAALSACHMLFYLSLCARRGLRVLGYVDDASGSLTVDDGDGSGRFVAITLRPRVLLARGADVAAALELHADAHRRCFLANSCAVPIRYLPTVESAGEEGSR